MVTFVDATQTDGFVGPSSEPDLAATSAEVSSPLPIAGPVSKLQVRVAVNGAGVTVTVVRNDVPTTLTCTTDATGSCSTTGIPVAFAAGDTISAEVQHSSGTFLRGVRWSTVIGS